MTIGTGSSFAWINPDYLKKWQGLSVLLEDGAEGSEQTSVIYALTTLDEHQPHFEACQSINDPICAEAQQFEIFQYFPVCEGEQIWCIEEVWAQDQSGNKFKGKFDKPMPSFGTTDFEEDKKFGMPASKGSGLIFDFPDLPDHGGTKYGVIAGNFLQTIQFQRGHQNDLAKYHLGDLFLFLSPVEIKKGNIYSKFKTLLHVKGGTTMSKTTETGVRCFLLDDGLCAAESKFPDQISFGIKLRIGSELSGWFHGRLSSPNVTIKKFTTYNEIAILGNPVKVPRIEEEALFKNIPQSTLDFVSKSNLNFGIGGYKKGDNEFGTISYPVSLPGAEDFFKAAMPVFNDTATSEKTVWSFYTLKQFGASQDLIRNCTNQSSSLAGIVTTNSLIYEAGPPIYDQATGTLNYKVVSPHFRPNKDIATGNYDLIISSEVARCIYKFSNAPIRGTVEVISDDGSIKIATTSVTENDGWIHLSANNFTFSSPTIKVKLSQDAPAKVTNQSGAVAPTPIQPTTVEKSKTLSKTITCIKGKNAKKVSGVNPKCPTGYKLK
jgi:hypothetical protein